MSLCVKIHTRYIDYILLHHKIIVEFTTLTMPCRVTSNDGNSKNHRFAFPRIVKMHPFQVRR